MAIKIFIDQGHNPSGVNAGAEANGLREQDVNYQVGVYLADLLRADPRFEVRLSRNYPTQSLGNTNAQSLAIRARLANSWPADYFISIHCNANPNPAINGTEMYIYKRFSQSDWFAERLLKGIVRTVGTKDNGVRVRPSLFVLRKTTMPAVLAELAYLTNLSDVEKLRNNQYGFAQGLYSGILDYFGFAAL